MSLLLPVASARAVRAEVGRLLRPRLGALLLAVLLLLVGATGRIVALLLLGGIVDVVATGDVAVLARLLAGLAGATAVGVLLEWQGGRLLAALLLERTATVREQVMSAALGRGAAQVEDAGTGDLLSRVSEDTASVAGAASRMLPAVVSAALTTLVTLAGVAVLDPRLCLAMLGAVPVQLVALHRFLRRSRPLYRGLRSAQSRRSQLLVEGLLGAGSLRSLRAEPAWSVQFAAASSEVVQLERRAARVRAGFGAGLNGAELLGLLGVLGTGFLLASSGRVSTGAVAAAALGFHSLFGPIGTLLASVDELQNAGTGLARLTGVLEAGSAAPSAGRAGAAGPDAARLHGVHHGYTPDRESVRGVDLTLRPGTVTAVIGLSGAGKSTVAKLLAGLLEPTAGRVQVAAGTTVAMVSQEFHVFRGTIWDNLRLARPDAGPDALRAAVRHLGAQWVLDLPDGGGTTVGEGGHPLTSAQAQHLALVRVHVSGADLVILDEATSEADSADSVLLDRAIARLLRGRTGLIVAHRLEQCALADEIVVLQDGRIVEQGGHAELLARAGEYARLWTAGGRASDR
ncbi:MAG TPA: ABC transporter ATP-binding protein [Cellulomonas sp.]